MPPSDSRDRPAGARWAELRYGWLLPRAAASRRLGDGYAQLAAAVELAIDRERRRVAVERIARWLERSRPAANRVYYASLVSEAREEADSAYFMRHPGRLLASFHAPRDEPAARAGAVYATFHLGSPILAYLYLCGARGVPARAIGRRLDPANRMPAAKRTFGRDKVAWVENFAGQPFLGVDAISIARAREHLLAGKSLYAAIDVPADVVARSSEIELFGERICIASGLIRLAALAGAPVQPIVAVHRGAGFEVFYGQAIAPQGEPQALALLAAEIASFVHRLPGEWWLWPYLTSAGDRL
jgi:hypothetical protein